MTREDIDNIISVICQNDEDFEKACISPAYLKKELETLALEQEPCELLSAQPEIIRCGQCKYAEVADPEDSQDGYTCQYHRGSIWFSGSFCSWAERSGEE